MKKRLLSITPYFGNTGSEIALLNVLEGISNSYENTVFTPNKHPSLKDGLSSEIVLCHPISGLNKKKSIIRKFQDKAIKPKKQTPLERWLPHLEYDTVLCNTLASLSFFKEASRYAKTSILYIHETEMVLPSVNLQQLEYALVHADIILCSSNYVKKFVYVLGRTKAVEVLYPTLDFSQFNIPFENVAIRGDLGYTPANTVWGMIGNIDTNKNPKAFIEVAKYVSKSAPNARFLWIGGDEDNAYCQFFRRQIKDENLEEVVQFIPRKDTDYYQYVNAMDGFMLTSKSESFSLVSLEACCFAKPVVSFNCGGVVEAVPEDNLFLIDDFSEKKMGQKIIEISKQMPLNFITKEVNNMFRFEKSNAGVTFVELVSKHL